jgi:hypothetical protein
MFSIDGNPKDRTARSSQAWVWYDPDDPTDLVERYSAAVARVGNVYLSVGVYREQRRAYGALSYLPGIFVDDYTGGAAVPASALLMTSHGNAQAFWYVPGGIDGATFHQLGKAAARATGGGANSSNATHLIRPPGSVNRKPGRDNYRTHLKENPDAPRYTVEQLRAAFPHASDGGPVAVPDLTSEEHEQIDYWRQNATHLLNDEGIPRRIVPRPGRRAGQTYNILRGIENVPGDGSSSMWRATLMRGLLLHGYPMPEAIALAMHLAPPDRGQDDAWLLTDALRLFEKEQAKLGEKYAPSASRPKGQNSPVKNHQNAPEPPRPRGRPRSDTLTADVLYAWFCDNAVGTPAKVLCTVGDVADELGVPRSQVERAERELRRQGLIMRSAKRWNSWVELPHFRPVKNPQGTKGRTVPAATPKTGDGAAQCNEHACAGETPHTPTGVCSPPNPPIAGATPEVPRNYREAVQRVLAKLPRADWRTVRDTCEAMGFDNAPAVRQWYEWAKNQKRYAREREKIQQYTPKELARQLAIADKKAARVQGQGREKPTEQELKQKPYWLWRWSELLTEQERREEAQPTPTPEPAAKPEPAPELPEGWRVVRCDHQRNILETGVYWLAVHDDGTMTDETQYRDSAARLAWAAARTDNLRRTPLAAP